MEEVLKTAIAYAPAVILVIVVVGVLLLGRQGWHRLRMPGGIEADREPPSAARDRSSSAAAAVQEARATRIALEQYGEVATSLAYLIQAGPNDVEQTAREWFSTLATRLAIRLKEQRDHHYRVAIWLDDPNYPDRFVCIGHGLFDRSDTDMDFLERDYTIGGLAFKSPNMVFYCRDRRTDPNFKPRRNIPPSFESVFGLALGKPSDRWGVMTVDARQANGFPEDAQWIIWRVGELASLGAIVWEAKVPPPLGPAGEMPRSS